ncbi:hypothetical protein [uncultured Veillonella sp.]|uniref:hypothetical protein n=1 Tax=uncultured Veillonella sp. TaxID=159268 RepID=UPI0025913BB8|nr:hypothetical protein [uncultured Veillonella sp.]
MYNLLFIPVRHYSDIAIVIGIPIAIIGIAIAIGIGISIGIALALSLPYLYNTHNSELTPANASRYTHTDTLTRLHLHYAAHTTKCIRPNLYRYAYHATCVTGLAGPYRLSLPTSFCDRYSATTSSALTSFPYATSYTFPLASGL